MIFFRSLTAVLLMHCLTYSTAQDTLTATVKIYGEVKKVLTLSGRDLGKLTHRTAMLSDHDGKEHTYSGVAVQQLFEMAGVTTGNDLRGENMTKYVMVRCMDGYETVFSLAELDSSFTDRVVILADAMDGKPLPSDKGPFRLVVPREKKHARSSMQVIEFVIRFAKE